MLFLQQPYQEVFRLGKQKDFSAELKTTAQVIEWFISIAILYKIKIPL